MLKAKIPIDTVVSKLAEHIVSENPAISMKAITEYLDRVYGKAQTNVALEGEMTTNTQSVIDLLGYKNMTKEQKTHLVQALDIKESGK